MANEIQVIRKQMRGAKKKRRKRGRIFKAAAVAIAFFSLGVVCYLLANQLLQQKGKTSLLTGGNIVSAQENSGEETGGTSADEIEWAEPVYEQPWNLVLVNSWNPITEYEEITFTELRNDQKVDSRIYPELQQMFDDARAAGLYPMISSSYRTTEKQRQLYDTEIAKYKKEGYSEEEAKKLAKGWVAVPGTSEHELGIAVDITTEDSNVQDASYIWSWLDSNCYKYGFIQRYPEGKKDLTGVNYEPWHYRYVGKEAAKEIFEQEVCLEEYLELQKGE